MQKKKVPEQILAYAKYVDAHSEEIAKLINVEFEKEKENIQEKIFDWIEGCFESDGTCQHYEWYDDHCPWDNSGDLKKCGNVDLEQTIEMFLDYEYTGDWTPTFESHNGKSYVTYGELLAYETVEIGGEIMLKGIKEAIEKEFSVKLSDEELYDVRDFSEDDFDEILCSCLAYDFGCCEGAIVFTGIGDIVLGDLLESRGIKCARD